jgi:hypothetical protein
MCYNGNTRKAFEGFYTAGIVDRLCTSARFLPKFMSFSNTFASGEAQEKVLEKINAVSS